MSLEESVLVVEDDEDLRNMLATYLGIEGFRVFTAPDGASMRRVLADHGVDLIVLDVLLPDGNGFNLVRELRRTSDTPIILLTGKSEPVDRIVGLELGADDYVCKPFETRELLARIRSVLRRNASRPQAAAAGPADDIAVFAGWAFDPACRQLHAPSGTEVRLTSAEFDLLRALVDNAQRPVSRDHLLKVTQARDWGPNDRSIDISISRLRHKLESDPKRPTLIKTVRNVGYVLTAVVSRESRANS